MLIKVWHCYHYGKMDTTILLAETDDILRAKVRDIIVSEWEEDEQGPMPQDFDDLMEGYHENCGDRYFGEWDWAVIDVSKCEELE